MKQNSNCSDSSREALGLQYKEGNRIGIIYREGGQIDPAMFTSLPVEQGRANRTWLSGIADREME